MFLRICSIFLTFFEKNWSSCVELILNVIVCLTVLAEETVLFLFFVNICLQFLPPVNLIPKSEVNLQEPCSAY